jgi:arsenate reductase
MDLVLFACTHNAGRSVMAEAFFNALADPSRARAVSAGTAPAERVHPVVAEAMAELGFDLSAHVPRLLTEELARTATRLVTMGCGEACPYVPGLRAEDWALADPAGRPLEEVRAIRDEVRVRVEELVSSSIPGGTCAPPGGSPARGRGPRSR